MDAQLSFRFGVPPESYNVTCSTVSDYDSFVRNYKDTHPFSHTHAATIERYYRLYLSLTKTRILFALTHLHAFKDTLEDYKGKSMTYFLDDLQALHETGVLVINDQIGKAFEMERTGAAMLGRPLNPNSYHIARARNLPLPPVWPKM